MRPSHTSPAIGDELAADSHSHASRSCRTARWPVERVLFALAGTMTLLTVLLAGLLSPWFLLVGVFVAINQWLYVTVGACRASLVLQKAGLQRRASW